MFVNMYQSDTKKTVESFFNAQYPFRQNRFETIYEKCYDSFFVRKNLYKCNVCQIKLLGDAELLKHNKCLEHQTELEKQIMVILDNPAVDTGHKNVKLSDSVKKMINESVIQTSKMELYEALAELKSEYEQYRKHPVLHPMYSKEWQIFYLRRYSDILADNRDPGTYNFTKDWSLFWVDRIQVYYSKRLQNVIDKIGAKYKVTLCDATFRENDSQMKTDKTSEATIEIDSDMTTEDENFEIPSRNELKTKSGGIENESESESESENDSENSDDGFTSRIRGPLSQYLTDKCLDREKKNPKKAWEMTTKTSSNASKQNVNETIAEQVLAFFNDCGLNPANLSDDQVINYIKYIIETSNSIGSR